METERTWWRKHHKMSPLGESGDRYIKIFHTTLETFLEVRNHFKIKVNKILKYTPAQRELWWQQTVSPDWGTQSLLGGLSGLKKDSKQRKTVAMEQRAHLLPLLYPRGPPASHLTTLSLSTASKEDIMLWTLWREQKTGSRSQTLLRPEFSNWWRAIEKEIHTQATQKKNNHHF